MYIRILYLLKSSYFVLMYENALATFLTNLFLEGVIFSSIWCSGFESLHFILFRSGFDLFLLRLGIRIRYTGHRRTAPNLINRGGAGPIQKKCSSVFSVLQSREVVIFTERLQVEARADQLESVDGSKWPQGLVKLKVCYIQGVIYKLSWPKWRTGRSSPFQ